MGNINKGNNLDTINDLLVECKKIQSNYKNSWYSIKYNEISKLFEKFEFTDVKVPMQLTNNCFDNIIIELTNLRKKYLATENKQKKNDKLTNSEMDRLIYKSWDKFTGFAPFLYGKLSDREISNKRQLIIDSIEFYKNK